MRRMGVLGRLANIRPLNMSVAESHAPGSFPRIVEVGEALKADGAGAILLGCAGMAGHRRALEEALGVPVIDPVQAATGMAPVSPACRFNRRDCPGIRPRARRLPQLRRVARQS